MLFGVRWTDTSEGRRVHPCVPYPLTGFASHPVKQGTLPVSSAPGEALSEAYNTSSTRSEEKGPSVSNRRLLLLSKRVTYVPNCIRNASSFCFLADRCLVRPTNHLERVSLPSQGERQRPCISGLLVLHFRGYSLLNPSIAIFRETPDTRAMSPKGKIQKKTTYKDNFEKEYPGLFVF